MKIGTATMRSTVCTGSPDAGTLSKAGMRRASRSDGTGRRASTPRATASAARRASDVVETCPSRESGSVGARKKAGPAGGMAIATTKVRMSAAAGAAARRTIGRSGAAWSMAATSRKQAAAPAQAERKDAAAAFVALPKATPVLKMDLAAAEPLCRVAGFCGLALGELGSRFGVGGRGRGSSSSEGTGERVLEGAGERPRATLCAMGASGACERAAGPAGFRGVKSEPTSMPGPTPAPQNALGLGRQSRQREPRGQTK